MYICTYAHFWFLSAALTASMAVSMPCSLLISSSAWCRMAQIQRKMRCVMLCTSLQRHATEARLSGSAYDGITHVTFVYLCNLIKGTQAHVRSIA